MGCQGLKKGFIRSCVLDRYIESQGVNKVFLYAYIGTEYSGSENPQTRSDS